VIEDNVYLSELSHK